MSKPLSEIESAVLPLLTSEWRPFRDILWEFNGPRELTIPQAQVQTALTGLTKRKILESRPLGAKTRGGGNYYTFNGTNAYRLREPANAA